MAGKLATEDFERHWPYALRILRRAIDRGPPITPEDRSDIEQDLALRLLRAADLSKSQSEYQLRAYVKAVVRSVRIDFFKWRWRARRAEQVATEQSAVDPPLRQGDEFSRVVVRELLDRFPGEHFATALQPLHLHVPPPVPATIRKQLQRSREKLAPVIKLVTGYKIANKK